jgi:MFS transporter, PHS family, inorganic phosphate transporter
MLAFVFWMQPLGQLIVLVIALIAIHVSEPIPDLCGTSQTPSMDCIYSLDILWRWVVGLGAVPAALAISFRLTIPQSPRFLMDNLNQVDAAAKKTAAYYFPDTPISIQMEQVTPLKANPDANAQRQDNSAFMLPPAARETTESFNGDDAMSVVSSPSVNSSIPQSSVPDPPPTHDELQQEVSWFAGFKKYFFTEGNWKLLAGTAGTWLMLDIPFYGLGLSSSAVVQAIWV